jgi:hypothetical protein
MLNRTAPLQRAPIRLAGLIVLAIATVITMMILTSSTTASTGGDAGTLARQWHRLNPDSPPRPPEHQLLTCHRLGEDGRAVWTCHYNKLREPALNFFWDADKGDFVGQDVTDFWTCPAWFPTSICANVTSVVEGVTVFEGASGTTGSVFTDLIVTRVGGRQVLQFYFVNQFVCPWFKTFSEALAANPIPLPFDGVNWPSQDCVVAP